jgi:hypothetical protein
MKIKFTLIVLISGWFAIIQLSQAACRKGCSSGENTFLGDSALVNNQGDSNTATGGIALESNTSGSKNTANGQSALYSNTTGSFNTAVGAGAVEMFTTASNNTGVGYLALAGEGPATPTGANNTAIGNLSLCSVQSGSNNTVAGYQALLRDSSGSNNTAEGYQALFVNTIGADNVAIGYQALLANTAGITNVAVGAFALDNSMTGAGNIAIGFAAGSGVTSGSNNIDIANNGASESSTIRIGSTNQTNTYVAGIYGVTVAGGIGVIVDSSGHLGTSTSSARFKENIQPMDKASDVILSLQPVTFRYKHELDPKGIPQFGLVAEQVEKIDPQLVARDEQGRPYSVRYEAVNAMLLNEFLKEHSKVEEQTRALRTDASEIARLKFDLATQRKDFIQQQQQIKALTSSLQKVDERLELMKSQPRLVTGQPITNN